ncbi:hypothetical protein GcM1_143003 [Golovinomyces cichoracearum]|uniref:Integrase and RNaseH domain-containing protein n=1 Tax=Golovinomyces cichoracearum TaxID=62708 RepID=A0A420JBQ6_9PEZI|nr:hypothetical protein GcM1_143003 [Golovinomyces cichoracearum]
MDPNPNPQFVEPVDYSEMTAKLRTRERNIQQATFDSQNQGRHSENTEESENTRLRNASGNRERNSRIGHRYPSFARTANDPRLFNNRSNDHYNVTYSDQHYHPTHNHSQQTTEPEYQPEIQQIVPAYEKSRAGPPTDRRMLTELAKVYTSDNIKYGGDMYDPLDSKLLIFEDWCNKLNVMGDDRDRDFSIILKGKTQEYYYTQCIELSLNLMIMSMKNHFETIDQKQNGVIGLLIDELEKLQRALPANLRDTKTLQDRLVSAFVEYCHIQYQSNRESSVELAGSWKVKVECWKC